jgi:hypothetical protein
MCDDDDSYRACTPACIPAAPISLSESGLGHIRGFIFCRGCDVVGAGSILITMKVTMGYYSSEWQGFEHGL